MNKFNPYGVRLIRVVKIQLFFCENRNTLLKVIAAT